jgi:hypothetical protein
MCEGCGLKHPGYGLASEGKARWCAGCGVRGEGGGAYSETEDAPPEVAAGHDGWRTSEIGRAGC